MSSKLTKNELILPVVALIAIVLDQISKRIVLTSLGAVGAWAPIPALGSWFSLTLVTNSGAAFGLFPGFGYVFMVVAIVVVVVIAVYYWHMPKGQLLISVSLGLQLGGAIGNLLDRVRYGYVIDFIDFKIWPVFNLADTCIVIGVALLALALLLDPGEERNSVAESKG